MDEEKTSQPPESASTKASVKRALMTQFSSVLALGASFLALSIGAYQARIMNVQTQLMQKQARAAVWPYISIGYSISDQGEKLGYTWEIDNDGVGPARIQSVTMSLDGKPMHSWDEVFKAIFGNAAVPATYTQFDGKVIAPNTNRETTIDAMRILTLEQAKVFYKAQDRFKMAICYCSVYDECWIANRQESQVLPVDRCDTTGTVQFEEKM
jgi:hypothetical protein